MADRNAALDYLRARLGMGEQPPGSNHVPGVTDVGGFWDAAWCVMLASLATDHAFGTDGRWSVPGIGGRFAAGFASTADARNAFLAAGLYTYDHASRGEPAVGQPGDWALWDWPGEPMGHTSTLEASLDDGTVVTLDGNYHDTVARVRRSRANLNGFCHVPYDGTPVGGGTPPPPPPAPAPAPGPTGGPVPPFPGTTRRGSRGPAVVAVQRRLADRGWHLTVDGDFGPETDRVVRGFQTDKGLGVDGIVGPITWDSLWRSPVTL
jgi:hypothetical protein